MYLFIVASVIEIENELGDVFVEEIMGVFSSKKQAEKCREMNKEKNTFIQELKLNKDLSSETYIPNSDSDDEIESNIDCYSDFNN